MAGLQGSDSAVCFHLQRIPQAKIGVNKLTIEIEIEIVYIIYVHNPRVA